MKSNTVNSLACASCKKPLEAGYIWLSAQNAELRWQIDKPDLSAWRFWSMSKGKKLLKSNVRLFPKTLRKAYRCVECDSLTIEHISKEFTS
ncbi:PF20097 family protein [Candidatus Leptofilum sp.]|uniref:PF20097 family protein n=1 Tax=Candidatus Leptofilum sp. TaxID=3241576 RepID=UPI003B5B2633